MLDQARNCPEVVEVAADAPDLPAALARKAAAGAVQVRVRAMACRSAGVQGIEGGGVTLASPCRGPAKRGPKG